MAGVNQLRELLVVFHILHMPSVFQVMERPGFSKYRWCSDFVYDIYFIFLFLFVDTEITGSFSNVAFLATGFTFPFVIDINLEGWVFWSFSEKNPMCLPYYSESKVSLGVASQFVDKRKVLCRMAD